MVRQYHKSFRGFYEVQGWVAFFVTFGYIMWNFYS